MIIPEYLQRQDMTEEKKRQLIAWIKTKRKKMKAVSTYDSENAATQAAVRVLKRESTIIPTVWKEPEDIGQRYAVVPIWLREDAQISGYTEKVGAQKIFDIAKRNVDEIEEV